MAKRAKRNTRPAAVADPRLEAKRAEKRELKRYLREARAVTRLTAQLRRAIENGDTSLQALAAFLEHRVTDILDSGGLSTGTEG